MSKKNSFIFYETIEEMLNELPDDEYVIFSKAVNKYGLHDIEPEFTGIRKALWTQIKFCIDNSKEYRRKQSENVAKRWDTNLYQSIPTDTNLYQDIPNVNDNVHDNVNVNENVNRETEKNMSVPDIPTKKLGNLQKEIYSMVQEHNKDAPKERKIPVSKDFWQFTCKESHELLEVAKNEPPDKIKAALQNFLQVAKSDTWQKTFSWRMFCNNFQAYTQEYFVLERYLNSVTDSEDPTKRPENVFFFANKDNPQFHVETFQAHIQDWKDAGRPQGKEYIKLQTQWEMGGKNAD